MACVKLDEPIARYAFFLGKVLASALASPVALGTVGIVERDAKVLLVRHSYISGWALAGGDVLRGEPPEQVMLCELREEIGLQSCAPPRLFGLYSRKA